MNRWPLYLASASPRRLELLCQIGLAPIVRAATVEETLVPGEAPRDMVRRLARAKGQAVAATLAGPVDRGPALIIAADTVVVLGGEILGKPDHPAEAEAMLRRLRGRNHDVLTGVYLERTDDGRSVEEVACTRVGFCDFDDATIRAYVASGEPLDKAGAYGIQGRGALFATRIEGSWSNVVGLPIERLPEWFGRIEVDLKAWIAWGAGPAQPSPISAS